MANICYIAHHGIEGQKWGQKNGPPYPLNDKVSKTVKKTKKIDEIGKTLENEDLKKPISIGRQVVSSGIIGGLTWGAIPVAVTTVATGGMLSPVALGIAFVGGVLAEGTSTYIRLKKDDLKKGKNQNG